MVKVKARRRRASAASSRRGPVAVTRISSKNQTTIPVAVLARAGLTAGDEVQVEADGAGRIVLSRPTPPSRHFAGCLTGVYDAGYLAKLRREWR